MYVYIYLAGRGNGILYTGDGATEMFVCGLVMKQCASSYDSPLRYI